jgi:C4-dicarboxylate-specific signal transduction histidine kinase
MRVAGVRAALFVPMLRNDELIGSFAIGPLHAQPFTASITHEVNQPIVAARTYAIAALNFLDRNPPDLQEVRETLAGAVKETDRVGAVVGRMRALMQKASLRSERVDVNEAVHEVIELTRGEALKNRVSLKTKFAEGLPAISGDRVQLQQVIERRAFAALLRDMKSFVEQVDEDQ